MLTKIYQMTPRTETRELTEHERLSLVKDKSQAIGDFVEWLAEKGIRLCREHEHTDDCYEDTDRKRVWPTCELRDGQFIQVYAPITKLLAEYFDIDENKLEREKREMLAEIRERTASRDIRKGLGLDVTR